MQLVQLGEPADVLTRVLDGKAVRRALTTSDHALLSVLLHQPIHLSSRVSTDSDEVPENSSSTDPIQGQVPEPDQGSPDPVVALRLR